jgi:hypothetical protein
LKFSIDLAKPATMMPKQAQPNPESQPMNGTRSMPQEGSSPKNIATTIGTQP